MKSIRNQEELRYLPSRMRLAGPTLTVRGSHNHRKRWGSFPWSPTTVKKHTRRGVCGRRMHIATCQRGGKMVYLFRKQSIKTCGLLSCSKHSKAALESHPTGDSTMETCCGICLYSEENSRKPLKIQRFWRWPPCSRMNRLCVRPSERILPF